MMPHSPSHCQATNTCRHIHALMAKQSRTRRHGLRRNRDRTFKVLIARQPLYLLSWNKCATGTKMISYFLQDLTFRNFLNNVVGMTDSFWHCCFCLCEHTVSYRLRRPSRPLYIRCWLRPKHNRCSSFWAECVTINIFKQKTTSLLYWDSITPEIQGGSVNKNQGQLQPGPSISCL